MKTNVYIATLPRSGSTLLGMILNNHPDIFHIGESSYWGKINPATTVCSCGLINCPLLAAIYETSKNQSEVNAIYQVCSQIDRLQEPNKISHALSLPDNCTDKEICWENIETDLNASCLGLNILADLFRRHTKRKIIVDNTKNAYLAKKIALRDWKIIILTRDPRGIANSAKNAGVRKNVPRPVVGKIRVFIDFAKHALELLEQSDALLVRYEDICDNPEFELTRICRHIGAEFKPSMLNFRADKGHTLMGNHMRFETGTDVIEDLGWQTQLNLEEIGLFSKNAELTELYSRLGYKFE